MLHPENRIKFLNINPKKFYMSLPFLSNTFKKFNLLPKLPNGDKGSMKLLCRPFSVNKQIFEKIKKTPV